MLSTIHGLRAVELNLDGQKLQRFQVDR